MKIPDYQIQNVLRLYFRQMGEGKILTKPGRGAMRSDTPPSASSEWTRQTITDKVAAGIVEKIITTAAEAAFEGTSSGWRVCPSAGKSRHQPDTTRFTYRLIDRQNSKTIQTAKAILPQRDHASRSD